ncbi:hypothetical protein GOBAR_DD28036 [Gossypium barbadense]|nr:hypothetical protein GOBAR_DD28036 [Gossypium barbadense]
MEESGGENREGRDEISLLADELIQLTVKGSKVVPNSKPTLICTVWTGKLYTQESFKAQMRSIWKTKKKFEIQMVEQNLYLIVFELEEDLESILEGRPLQFRKNLNLFNKLSQEMERDQISLTSSLFWLKIDSLLPEFDKKDLPHAIGVTFGGLLDLKLVILAANSELVWMFGNHYVESSYTRGQEVLIECYKIFDKKQQELKELQENTEIMGGKDLLKLQENNFGTEEVVEIDNSKAQEGSDINHEKRRWKSIKIMDMEVEAADANRMRKRKFTEEGSPRSGERVGIKRVKMAEMEESERVCSERMMESAKQTEGMGKFNKKAKRRPEEKAY